MGIIESHHLPTSIFPEQSRQINEQQFTIIPNYSYTRQVDPYYGSNFIILAHKQRTQFQLQKYQLFFNTYQQYKSYEEVYEWRNKSKHLVQAKAIKERANNKICGNFHQATIFVERIPIRACQIMDVPIEQGLYLLYTCFMGFRKIYQRTGYFDIILDMICINKDALVKIWLNNNLSKIYPQFYSLDQNFSQTDFIYKLLAICQPLIDFTPISEKFSEFLKGCCFSYQQSIKKQTENKFCKYSKFKESSNYKKQLQSNVGLLSFDKIIQYFQGYLNKHKLVIAREMKSIRDLFKIQAKIQYKDAATSKNQTNSENLHKQIDLGRLQLLPIVAAQHSQRKKTGTKRINTKRTNNRLATDRSNTQKPAALFSYKSQECVKNLRQLKQPDFFAHKQPSVSFGYRPINTTRNNINTTRNQYPTTIYSPQHLPQKKQICALGRDRIKTTVSPNISFFIRPKDNQIQYSLSPNHSYKSTQNFFFKKKGKQQILDQQLKQLKEDILRRQSFPGKIQTQQKIIDINELKQNNLTKKQTFKSSNKQAIKKRDIDKKRKTYYAVEKEVSIDQEIAFDLDKFQMSDNN